MRSGRRTLATVGAVIDRAYSRKRVERTRPEPAAGKASESSLDLSVMTRASRAAILIALCFLIARSFDMRAQRGAVNGEWLWYGGDAAGTKYSPLDQINASNVSQLQIAWRWKREGFGSRPDSNWQVTPLMIGGALYFTAGTSRAAVAVEASSGDTLWTYLLDEGARGAQAPRTNHRGLASGSNGPEDARLLLI